MNSDTQFGTPIADPNNEKPRKEPEDAIQTESRPYNDLWAAILWMLAMLVVVTFGIIGYHAPREPDAISEEIDVTFPSARRVGFILITGALTAFVSSTGLMALTRHYARQVIYASNGLLLGLYVVGIASALSSGNGYGALGFGILLLIHGIFLAIFRKRIPFAALCIQTSARLVQRQRGLILTGLGFALVQIVFYSIWANALVDWTNGSSHEIRHSIFWPWLFFLFWGVQVFRGIVHATVCGFVAMWYFTGGAVPANPALGALRRACSYSLGSICLGSLIVALLNTLCAFLRALTRQGGNDHAFLRAVARYLVNAVESLAEYFNAYAFVHIAIYGTPYIESAKATWRLVKSSAVRALVNDDFTNIVTMFLVLFSTLISAGLCGALYHMPGEFGWAIPSLIGGSVGFFVSFTIFGLLSSGVMALFVCYIEQPDTLHRVNPSFAVAMERAASQY